MNHQTKNYGAICLHLAVNQYSDVWLVEAASLHTRDRIDDDDG